jgi:protein-L-isoaspartate(D-aspartate) O-methyltransferase
LVDQLCQAETIRTPDVEQALRVVPRHSFVPTASLTEAYADDPVYTKYDDAGASISAASQPTIVAMMLEQLQAQPGERILEVGAGTGYNAGLLAHLVGEAGHVTTIDVDADIVDGARASLAAAGITNVTTVLGDGALGHTGNAPYDRIIATVGVWDLPPSWMEQLAPHGRLVAPVRLRGSVSRSVVFGRDGDRWVSRSSEMSTFMPLRGGIADDPRGVVNLTADGAVTIQIHQDQAVDSAALTRIFDQPRTEAWTAVTFRGAESFEWLYLWLGCRLPNALSRMPVDSSADYGLVTPQFGWGAMATTESNGLAYLTHRPVSAGKDRRYEVGVIGHGPGGDMLTSKVVDAIREWNANYRARAVQFQILPKRSGQAPEGQFTFDMPQNWLSVSWA